MSASVLLSVVSVPLSGQEPHVFTTADGAAVYAYRFAQDTRPRARALILAFHQGGGDARGEYGPIVPRLLAAGFDVLAVDLRSGGNLFGGVNQTVSARPRSAPYCEAAADVEGALDVARRLGAPRIILWGSSYSGALVLRAAARDTMRDIVAVLAFSPATGPPMTGCLPENAAAGIDTPTLILASGREADGGPLSASVHTYRSQGHTVFVARPGAHGSSMLVPDRVQGSVEETWNAVLSFLDRTMAEPDG